jgi:hypothetical protein
LGSRDFVDRQWCGEGGETTMIDRQHGRQSFGADLQAQASEKRVAEQQLLLICLRYTHIYCRWCDIAVSGI